MKPGSNGKGRPRGRNNNQQVNKSRGPSRNQTFDSNGPGIRVRGNAHQVVEKYQALARDAAASGDRVLMENYLQHAEHYYRIILVQNQNNPIKANRLDQGNALDGPDDFADDESASDGPDSGGPSASANRSPSDQGAGGDGDDGAGNGDGDGEGGSEASASDDGGQERKPRRRSRSVRAREAGEAERRDGEARETGDGDGGAAAAPQSPAELAAAVAARDVAGNEAGGTDVKDEPPKKPRRRRTRAAASDEESGEDKEVASA
jgi:hypothetical protein